MEIIKWTMRFESLIRLVSVCSYSISSESLLDGILTSKETSHHRTNHSFENDFHHRRGVLKRLATSFTQLLLPKSCYALTPVEAERQYNTYASNYDQLDGGQASSLLGIDEARRRMIEQAHGKVLEVGVGTGLNLNMYKQDQISSLTLVDISNGMLQKTKAKAATLPNLRNIEVSIIKADMTSQLVDLFGSESFDTVIDTFSMCVLGEDGVQRSLDQLSHVVRTKKDGGQLLFLENSRSSIPFVGLYQDATADIASKVGGKGCIYNQDIGRLIRASSRLSVVDETEFAAGLFRSFRIMRND